MKIKTNLFCKIISGYIAAIFVIAILTLVIAENTFGFRQIAYSSEMEILPNTLNAKDLQMHVIQVQQWLTDISATRGAEGFDDGYDEAEEHANNFREIIQEYKTYYGRKNNPEKITQLEQLSKSFEEFYDVGKQMADAYIKFGPEKGNIFMEKFDPFAEEIYDSVNVFVNDQVEELKTGVGIIDADSYNLLRLSIILGVISTVVLVVLGIIISKLISKPIKNFTAILKDISEGEGDLTRRIEIKTSDEIGDMANYFNNTFEKIQHLVSSVQDQSERLENIGVELASNMTETAAAINQITENIKSIKNQTINQSTSVTETSSTIEQISGGIDRLNQLIEEQDFNIKESETSVRDLIKSIDSVESTLAKNTQNIEELTQTSQAGRIVLDKITEAIHEVSHQSESLMEISSVIQGIASQTNLLAMNAAIEAAHAGETGKGFAVVADEVRKLAVNSSVQTNTITTVLSKIKESIATVIEYAGEVVSQFTLIENGVATVSNQESAIRQTVENQSMDSKNVLQALSKLNEISNKVQSSSVEMLNGSNQITSEARNMSNITQEINGGMNEMASGADQISEAVTTVNDLSSENKTSISALLNEVKKFKV